MIFTDADAVAFGFQIVSRGLQIADQPLDLCNRRRSHLLNQVPDRFAQFPGRFDLWLELREPIREPIPAHGVADFFFNRLDDGLRLGG